MGKWETLYSMSVWALFVYIASLQIRVTGVRVGVIGRDGDKHRDVLPKITSIFCTNNSKNENITSNTTPSPQQQQQQQ